LTTQTLAVPQTPYRNFNLCPHCIGMGEQALLSRLCEGLPMISRSDGKSFHLFLADQRLPYPIEKDAGPSSKVSVCFWYAHAKQPHSTFSTIVILESPASHQCWLFRKIELVADLLADRLGRDGTLVNLYEFLENRADGKLS
jgi:hypothetical protein